MTDCRFPALQDLLPDYVAASLEATAMSAVEAHVQSCTACAEDVALLRTVRALRPPARQIDVGRIVASLPASTRTSRGTAHDVIPISQAPSVRRQAHRGSAPPSRARTATVWRVAAAIGVIVIGGATVLVTRERTSVLAVASAVDTVRRLDSAASPIAASESLMLAMGADDVEQGGATAVGGAAAISERAVAVSYGDLGDYTDDELQRVLDRLERWDGTSSAEPLPSLSPVTAAPVPTQGGSSL